MIVFFYCFPPRSMSNALIAMARIKIVIATNIRFQASSKPPVILVILADAFPYVEFHADREALAAAPEAVEYVGISASLIVKMRKANAIIPAKTIPIIKTTPRSTIPLTLLTSFLTVITFHATSTEQR